MADLIQSIVTSSRVRLARNLAAYPFPEKLRKEQAAEIIEIVGKEIAKAGKFNRYVMKDLPSPTAAYLQEQHWISPALLKNKDIGAAFISKDRDVSVMINEEDHIREQYIFMGYDLFKTYERLSAVDDRILEKINIAYDDRLGFLTACPSNLGTGMRASVMMFLPGLAKSKALEELVPKLKANGMTVRGVFGEGSAAEGYNYQISNERTLGTSEGNILQVVNKVALKVCDLEIREREKMLKKERVPLRDSCLRAFGALTNCAILPLKELTECMVKIKLGVALGFFSSRNMNDFNTFVANMRPASFRVENELQGASDHECDMARAEIVGKVLPELIQRIN